MSSFRTCLGSEFHVDCKDDSKTNMSIISSASMLVAHPFVHLYKRPCIQVQTLQVAVTSPCKLQVELKLWLESDGGR